MDSWLVSTPAGITVPHLEAEPCDSRLCWACGYGSVGKGSLAAILIGTKYVLGEPPPQTPAQKSRHVCVHSDGWTSG